MKPDTDRMLRDVMATYVAMCPEPPDVDTPDQVRVAPGSGRWRWSPVWAFASAFLGVLAVGVVVVVLSVGGDAPDPAVGGLAPIELGPSYIWPKQPGSSSPEELVAAFAVEVLGWNGATVERLPGADPTGPVWVQIRQPGREAIDILTAPHLGPGRVLLQIGAPSSVGPAVPGEIGASRFGLVQPSGATQAELTVRVAGSATETVFTADAGDLELGRVETPDIPDANDILTMIVRYLDDAGDVVSATGGVYSSDEPGATPTRCPAGDVSVAGDPQVGYPTVDTALNAAADANNLVSADFVQESSSNTWVAGSSGDPRAVIELSQRDGTSEWFIDTVTICTPDPFTGRVEQGTSTEFTALPYRLLIQDADVGDVYVTDVAANTAEFTQLWSTLGLVGQPPDVDFESWVVFYFGAVESQSCPLGTVQGLTYNAGDEKIYPEIPIVIPPGADGCNDDAHRHAVLVAVERNQLPDGGFSLWISADDPPGCCLDGMSFIAPGELTASPDAGFPPLGADGSLAVGESRIAYGVNTHCGVEWLLRSINGQTWRATDLDQTDASGIDPVPSAWGQANQPVDLIVTLIDDDTLKVSGLGTDATVTYTPDPNRPGCA